MMLDTKSEQKWPLISRSEEREVKGHFFLILVYRIETKRRGGYYPPGENQNDFHHGNVPV